MTFQSLSSSVLLAGTRGVYQRQPLMGSSHLRSDFIQDLTANSRHPFICDHSPSSSFALIGNVESGIQMAENYPECYRETIRDPQNIAYHSVHCGEPHSFSNTVRAPDFVLWGRLYHFTVISSHAGSPARRDGCARSSQGVRLCLRQYPIVASNLP